MKKATTLSAFTVISTLLIMMVSNFTIHALLYMVDGSLEKFFSPIWVLINGIMLGCAVAFGLLLHLIHRPTPPTS